MSERLEEELSSVEEEVSKAERRISNGRTRKKRSDAGKSRGSGKRSRTSARSLWLEKAEAQKVTRAIAFYLAGRYGDTIDEPNAREQEHLAHVIRAASKYPPLSLLQPVLARLFPIADPKSKPGRSVPGDLLAYVVAWYRRNPDLAKGIYFELVRVGTIPAIPFVPNPVQYVPYDDTTNYSHNATIDGYIRNTYGYNPDVLPLSVYEAYTDEYFRRTQENG